MPPFCRHCGEYFVAHEMSSHEVSCKKLKPINANVFYQKKILSSNRSIAADSHVSGALGCKSQAKVDSKYVCSPVKGSAKSPSGTSCPLKKICPGLETSESSTVDEFLATPHTPRIEEVNKIECQSLTLETCRFCNRTFSKGRLQKHERICEKLKRGVKRKLEHATN